VTRAPAIESESVIAVAHEAFHVALLVVRSVGRVLHGVRAVASDAFSTSFDGFHTGGFHVKVPGTALQNCLV